LSGRGFGGFVIEDVKVTSKRKPLGLEAAEGL
jgi:hypothetical protein